MRLLLDTQIFLWMQTEPDRLGALKQPIENEANELILSAASSWEIAIKHGLGRLSLPELPDVYVPTRMSRSGVAGLPIHHSHALRVSDLPAHHRDPFDRLLVTQVMLEELTLASADPVFDRYDIDVLRP